MFISDNNDKIICFIMWFVPHIFSGDGQRDAQNICVKYECKYYMNIYYKQVLFVCMYICIMYVLHIYNVYTAEQSFEYAYFPW